MLEELRRQILDGNRLILRLEVVSVQAEAADPDFVDRVEINNREWIDHRSPVAAQEGEVEERRRGLGKGFSGV